ncbi:MAG: FKBP-type peptidyl-prolyl cis-trans isomerase [Bacteroidales bacterium]|nr:FKBP-type peptidyl-prolyl cis-trans isomerase [Candidatus Colimorpha onthohippi]
MKTRTALLVAACFAISVTACKNTDAPKLENTQDSISWVIGENMAQSLLNNRFDIDTDMVVKAFVHTLNRRTQPIDDATATRIFNQIQRTMEMQMRKSNEERMADMQKEEQKYFAALEQKNPQIKKTPEGLYYEVMKEGNGPTAKLNDVIVFDYRGYHMLSGELFDQTYGNRKPIRHVLSTSLMPGLMIGLQLMNAGSQYRLYIPSKLGFPNSNVGQAAPNTPLVYEVELHSINE